MRLRSGRTFVRTTRRFLEPQAARFSRFFIFFSDFFGTGAQLGPDFAPLSLQTLILIASGFVLEGVQTPRILKKPWFLLGFSWFFAFPLCSLGLALEPHFWSLLAPFGTSFRSILAPSWRPGPPFASQVGLLGGLAASKLASWGVLGPPSWPPWPPGPPSWPPTSDFGLQVGLLSQLWTSKLASGASFWLQSWSRPLALGLSPGY